eukprot:3814_1
MKSTSAQTLEQFLSEHTASEINTFTINNNNNDNNINNNVIIELDSNLTPIDAATILWKKNIVGAPVWDDDKQKYIGFFEMRDIVSALIANAKVEKGEIIAKEDRFEERM